MAKVVVRDIDRGYQKLAKQLLEKVDITVGVHEDEGAAPADGSEGTTIADIAAFNEFGTQDIPPRSFIRDWYDEALDENTRIMAEAAKSVTQLKLTLEDATERVGLRFQGDVRKRIISGIDPPNEQSTIDKKGSSTPLIDEGQLLGAITYKVTPR